MPGFVSAGVRADPPGSTPSDEGDLLFGEGGNDILLSGGGTDAIFGGGGDDIFLSGDGGDDIVFGEDGNDLLNGIIGNDILFGGSGIDTLNGGGDNDVLDGGSGIDTLNGGSGKDILVGGPGKDTLNGQTSDDIYDFNFTNDSLAGVTPIGFPRDVIQSFGFGGSTTGDKIDLSNIDANETLGGNQTFQYIDTAAFSVPGQVRVSEFSAPGGQVGDATVIQLNTDSDLFAESEIQVNDGPVVAEFWANFDFVL